MTNEQIVTPKTNSEAGVQKTSPAYRSTPAVDIYETDDSLTLLADMPGVEEHDLQIEVDRGVLSIEGDYSLADGGKAGYFRQFKISERIDVDAGEAVLSDGVLKLRLPKFAAEKPTRITVKTLH